MASPCSSQPGIGLDAINDALLLEACIYRLLKFYCREQPYYLNLLELFLQVRCSRAGAQQLCTVALSSGTCSPAVLGFPGKGVMASRMIVSLGFSLLLPDCLPVSCLGYEAQDASVFLQGGRLV